MVITDGSPMMKNNYIYGVECWFLNGELPYIHPLTNRTTLNLHVNGKKYIQGQKHNIAVGLTKSRTWSDMPFQKKGSNSFPSFRLPKVARCGIGMASPQDSVLVGHSKNYFDLRSPPLNENLAILNGQRLRSHAYSPLFGLIEPRGVLCGNNIVDG